MEEEHIVLITKFIDGELTPSDQLDFEKLVEKGEINIDELSALANLKEGVLRVTAPEPSAQMKADFYKMLSTEQSRQIIQKPTLIQQLNEFIFGNMLGKMAFGVTILAIGLVLGNNFLSSSHQTEISNLNGQMIEMKEMMMMSMLEKESVSDRLKGVQMSSELSSSNQKVIEALFLTLNNDKSANVRIAALNALAEYKNDPQIREGLVNSITQQESPLVQMALATLMVELQEKKAVDEFNTILNDEFTPEEVKISLKERIEKIM